MTAAAGPKSRLAIAGAVVALLWAPAPSLAAARDGTVPLRGTTTIRWHGNVGIRIRVPQPVSLTRTDVRLWVPGGTFAAVRWVAEAPCAPPLPARCTVGGVTYLRDLAVSLYGGRGGPTGAGSDHVSHMGNPEHLRAGVYELYLLSDRPARLELRIPSLPGSASYQATGRIHGRADFLLPSCPAACDPAGRYGGTVSAGGRQVHLPATGYAHSMAYSARRSRNQNVPDTGEPRPARACVYPTGGYAPSTSPADHPLGCETVSAHPEGVAYEGNNTTTEVDTAVQGSSGVVVSIATVDLRGKGYLGYRAGSANGSSSVLGGFGVWFVYGIGR